MTEVNQDFNDPELESIIDNAFKKTITANEVGDLAVAWVIITIILYATAAGAELIRFKQTRNRLHLALSMSAILVVLAYALIWARIIDAFFLFSVAGWIAVIVPAYLLSIWLCSMTGCLHNPYSRYFFKFVQVWFVFFNIAKLLECIFYILTITTIWYKVIVYYVILEVAYAIEIVGSVLFLLLCAWIHFGLQNVVHSELLLKRRQLRTIFLIYFTMTISFSASAAMNSISRYISVSVLVAYFALTLIPHDAITGFDKVPDSPAVALDSPVFVDKVQNP
jgi:hypothetical protein